MERMKPYESLKLDPELLELVKDDTETLLEILNDWRERFAVGRKVEFDKMVAKRPGFGADALSGRRSLTIDRMFALIRLFDKTPEDLARAYLSRTQVPNSPRDWFQTFKFEPDSLLRKLDDWALTLVVQEPDGHSMGIDYKLLRIEAHRDSAKARELAELDLSTLLYFKPPKLNKRSVINYCWILKYLARCRRAEGKLTQSAAHLAVAFRLESLIEHEGTRAFLFRERAMLLCHSGDLKEAERCAQVAVELCLAADPSDDSGLAESLYRRAWMVKWRGEVELALKLMNATLRYIEETDPEDLRVGVRLALALFRIEMGELSIAAKELSSLGEFDSMRDDLRGRAYFIRALLRSAKGERELSDDDFLVADKLLANQSSPADMAVCLLYKCIHYQRYRMGQSLADAISQLPRLAAGLEAGSTGEAALLEVARTAIHDLSHQAVISAIRALEKPWAQWAQGNR